MANAGMPDEAPEADVTGASAPAESERFGLYVARHPLPETGLGLRFSAERARPVRRLVTLHVIEGELDAYDLVEQYRAGRARLSALDDPRLVPLLDAGVSDRGRAYFASAPADGAPIVSYCDARRLDVAGRLELFAEACDAVQRAHQCGVLHGRLVPLTILVGLAGGIERIAITEVGLAATLMSTHEGRLALIDAARRSGHALALPPELVESPATHVDTRADVYLLGLVLYQLLTGRRSPFALASSEELPAGPRHTPRAPVPVPPSERVVSNERALQEIAATRRCTPAELPHLLRGKLDEVVLRCLDAEPSNRYATVAELAADARRQIDVSSTGSRIAAGALASATRQLARNRAFWMSLAAALAAILVAGSVFLSMAVREQRRAERHADVARERAASDRRVSSFLLTELLAPPGAPAGEQAGGSMRAALDRAAASAAWRLGDDERAEARVRCALGAGYRGVGEPALAKAQLERCVTLHRAVRGDEHPATLAALFELAAVLREQGLAGQAEPLLAEVLGARRKTLGDPHPETRRAIDALASLYVEDGRDAMALPLLRERVRESSVGAGRESEAFVGAAADLGRAYARLGRAEDAETVLMRALDGALRLLGDEHETTMTILSDLGKLYAATGRPADAAETYARLLAIQRGTLGNEHPATIETMAESGQVLVAAGRFDDAEPLLDEAVFRSRAVLAPEHPVRRDAMLRLSACLAGLDRHDDAEKVLLRLYRDMAAAFGRAAPETVAAGEALVELYDGWGRTKRRDTWKRLLSGAESSG